VCNIPGDVPEVAIGDMATSGLPGKLPRKSQQNILEV